MTWRVAMRDEVAGRLIRFCHARQTNVFRNGNWFDDDLLFIGWHVEKTEAKETFHKIGISKLGPGEFEKLSTEQVQRIGLAFADERTAGNGFRNA
jgi:hypothetical protein